MTEINFTENLNPSDKTVGFTDYMFVEKYTDGEWVSADIMPYGTLPLPVWTTGLMYGLCVSESVRLTLDANGGICVLRADAHAARLFEKADKLSIPTPDFERVLYVINELAKIDRRFITKTATVFATLTLSATDVGITPLPVKNAMLTITLEAHEKRDMTPLESDVGITLDGVYNRFAVSAGGLDIFFRMDGKLMAPKGDGVIRDSVLKLARLWHIDCEECDISMDEVVRAYTDGELKEVFAVSTFDLVRPITEITYNGKKMSLPSGKLSRKLFDAFTTAELGSFPSPDNWTVRL